LNQIRQLTNRVAPAAKSNDGQGIDQADADGLVNQQKFLTNTDPLLTATQQAKVRPRQWPTSESAKCSIASRMRHRISNNRPPKRS
jgi:hypothetical protein